MAYSNQRSGKSPQIDSKSPSFGSRRRPNRSTKASSETAPRSAGMGWSIWCDRSGTASEDIYDATLRAVDDNLTSSAQFHERFAKLKREGIDKACVRVFRTGILPFSRLSKNRGGGQFMCSLHTGTSAADAAACFATVVEKIIDGDLRWAEAMNGVCLSAAKRKCYLKLWSSSSNDHNLAPVTGVIEQLNAILAPELKDPVTFDIIDPSTPVSSPACSPFGLAPLVGGVKPQQQRAIQTQSKGPVEPSVPPPVPPPPPPPVEEQGSTGAQHDEEVRQSTSEAHSSAQDATAHNTSSAQNATAVNPKEEQATRAAAEAKTAEEAPMPLDMKDKTQPKRTQANKSLSSPPTQPKSEGGKRKKTKGSSQKSSDVVDSVPKKELTEEQQRLRAKQAAERRFNKNEKTAGWSRERSVAWLWLLAFPLVYIVIGWLFCILMNNSNPGAYPQRFSF